MRRTTPLLLTVLLLVLLPACGFLGIGKKGKGGEVKAVFCSAWADAEAADVTGKIAASASADDLKAAFEAAQPEVDQAAANPPDKIKKTVADYVAGFSDLSDLVSAADYDLSAVDQAKLDDILGPMTVSHDLISTSVAANCPTGATTTSGG